MRSAERTAVRVCLKLPSIQAVVSHMGAEYVKNEGWVRCRVLGCMLFVPNFYGKLCSGQS